MFFSVSTHSNYHIYCNSTQIGNLYYASRQSDKDEMEKDEHFLAETIETVDHFRGSQMSESIGKMAEKSDSKLHVSGRDFNINKLIFQLRSDYFRFRAYYIDFVQ